MIISDFVKKREIEKIKENENSRINRLKSCNYTFVGIIYNI